MGIDTSTLASWLDGLGLDVTSSPSEVRAGGAGTSGCRVHRSDRGAWEVVVERRVSASSLSAEWHTRWDDAPPDQLVARSAQAVAWSFPLVDADAHPEGGGVVVTFRAPLFEENLSRQALVLTVSSALRAGTAFDDLIRRRGEALAQWTKLEAHVEDTVGEFQAALPFTATHFSRQPLEARATPDPSSAVTDTIDARVPFQVTEREGDWAHVLCENGWSAWVDGRRLEEGVPA